MSIAQTVQSMGGLAATHELKQSGYSKYRLRRAVLTGELIRVRQGWYILPSTPIDPEESVRVGGRATCVTGARQHGLWVRNTVRLHVCVPPHGSRLRTRRDRTKRLSSTKRSDVIVHWTDSGRVGTRFNLSATECLRDMIFCQSPERVVAAVDSAIRLGILSPEQWWNEIAGLPRRLRRLLGRIDARSESITESIVRFRLQMLGIACQLQVKITGVGRVDILIGKRLVIEVDGRDYHVSSERFEADRERDAKLSVRGYRVLRFSYQQIMNNWALVRAAILAAIARDDHL
jgi:very-short-patch-repair endonuclease